MVGWLQDPRTRGIIPIPFSPYHVTFEQLFLEGGSENDQIVEFTGRVFEGDQVGNFGCLEVVEGNVNNSKKNRIKRSFINTFVETVSDDNKLLNGLEARLSETRKFIVELL